MLRLLVMLSVGGLATWVAYASYVIFQAAAKNNASPGALILIPIAAGAALVAVVAWLSALVSVLLLLFGRRAD